MTGAIYPRLFVVVAFVVTLMIQSAGLFNVLERSTFDHLLGARARSPWPADFVLVEADAAASEIHGSWPWSEEKAAIVFNRLTELGARTIAAELYFDWDVTPEQEAEIGAAFSRVILPVFPYPEASRAPIVASALLEPGLVDDVNRRDVVFQHLWFPPPGLASQVRGIGHTLEMPGRDQVVRTHLPFVCHPDDGRVLPSFPLVALAAHRGIDLPKATARGEALSIPGLPPLQIQYGQTLLDVAQMADRPVTVRVSDLFDPSQAGALRAQLDGKLVLLYEPSGMYGTLQLPGRAVPEASGYAAALAIRTLAMGNVPTNVTTDFLLGCLFLLSLAGAGFVSRRRPGAVVTASVGSIVLYVVASEIAVRRLDMILPIWGPASFLLLNGIALAISSAFRIEKRLAHAEGRADAAIAPKGNVALVFTDVKGSTRLWEKVPDEMHAALEIHNELMRNSLAKARGYEVKTEGDAFMVAFADPIAAARWALDVQSTLVQAPWPGAILEEPEAAEERSPDGVLLFRGLRVRMGIHVGTPACIPDPKTGRMDYFGPVVNRAARVSGSAQGGQVVLSTDAWRALQPRLPEVGLARTRELGAHRLKGIDEEEHLVEILPEALRGRSFGLPPNADEHGSSPKIPLIR